ncbi:Putative LOC100373930, partial [Caligus rogercresseyi]
PPDPPVPRDPTPLPGHPRRGTPALTPGGEDFCPAQPNLPLWHAVAGSSGLLIPILYLLFDEINPRISRRFPALSELFDNAVVFILPLYLIFEVAWLIT